MPPEQRLPFEPGQSRKKADKNRDKASTPEQPTPKSVKPAGAATKPSSLASSAATNNIPQVVSQRMARRMAFFCGLPTSCGVLTFVASYVVVTQHWLKLPNVAVLLVSMGFFGLGVLGLSYGVLSACWDEEQTGSLLGLEQFSLNLSRLLDAWRASRQKS